MKRCLTPETPTTDTSSSSSSDLHLNDDNLVPKLAEIPDEKQSKSRKKLVAKSHGTLAVEQSSDGSIIRPTMRILSNQSINYDEPDTKQCGDFSDGRMYSFYIPTGCSYGEYGISTSYKYKPDVGPGINDKPYYWFNTSPWYWFISPFSLKAKCVRINLLYSFEIVQNAHTKWV